MLECIHKKVGAKLATPAAKATARRGAGRLNN